MKNRDLDNPTIDVVKVSSMSYAGLVDGKMVTEDCDTSLKAYHLALKWAYRQGYDVLCRE